MSNLIAKLEATTKGNRELDDEIENAVYGPPTPSGNFGDKKILFYDHRNGASYSISPAYTTSLDAALTLMPEGKFELRGPHKGIPKGPFFIASITPNNAGKGNVGEAGNWVPRMFHAEGATPALAMCSAALKAFQGSAKDL